MTFANHPNNRDERYFQCRIFEVKGDFLLGSWPSHADYQQQTANALSLIAQSSPHSLLAYETAISKLYILDLDPLRKLIAPLYSATGRPAINQPEIFRSLVLMSHLGCKLDNWNDRLMNFPVLQAACGFSGKLPGTASYYDFIDRIIKLDEKPRVKRKKHKPKKNYGKEKMPAKHPGIVQKLVVQILIGRRFNTRMERVLQEIFAQVCVQRSIEMGLLVH